MTFVTVREIRIAPGRVWKHLSRDRDIVVTSNGRPIALLTSISGENLEETLANLRRARGLAALERIQAGAARNRVDRLATAEIETEIAEVRRARGTRGSRGR